MPFCALLNEGDKVVQVQVFIHDMKCETYNDLLVGDVHRSVMKQSDLMPDMRVVIALIISTLVFFNTSPTAPATCLCDSG